MLNIVVLDFCASNFRPLSETRPVVSLLAGCFTFEERIRKLFPNSALELRACPSVAEVYSVKSNKSFIPKDETGRTLYLKPNVVYNLEFARMVESAEGDAIFKVDETVVAILTHKPFDKGWFEIPPDWPVFELDLIIVPAIWDLVNINASIITADFDENFRRAIDGQVHPQAAIYGENAVAIERGAEVFAGAVLDAREGPIIVSRGAIIRPGAIIQGPCFIGQDTVVLSGWIREDCSFGPMCKIAGEVESSIFIGYSNKGHEGFVGHSYIGQWVNLGALTTTSDLKNNYGKIRIDFGDGQIDTGRIKVGSFIGDHSKTGIGALLNSGTYIGVSVNHYGTGLPPKFIKSFSWGTSQGYVEYEFEKAISTAKVVMSRRGEELQPEEESLLKNIYKANWNKK
ncbi:hypothetical protein KAH81_03445 [bacterium]|nr:hypothetical protein [bacterium]